MYLTNNKHLDITLSVSLLARYSSSHIRCDWDGVKHTFRYLRGITDIGSFYAN